MTITTKSWIKDTSDLFDFEATNLSTKSYTVREKNTFVLVNDKDEVSFVDTEKDIDPISIVLGQVKNEDGYWVIPPLQSEFYGEVFCRNNIDRMWGIVKGNNSQEIIEGDIIKLGRVRLKISKIVFDKDINYTTNYNNYCMKSVNNNATSVNVSNIANDDVSFTSRSQLSMLDNKICCRICYRNDNDSSDPLISPCKCTGSMAYIHYRCLKSCIDSRITKKEDEISITYLIKSYACEICRTPYPRFINYRSSTLPLVDVDTNKFQNFLVLDYSVFDDNSGQLATVGVIVVRIEDEVTIGRTQSNDIKLKDISVSRQHCAIVKRGNKIYIEDKGAKFGTMLYQKNKKKLSIDEELTVISGKHMMCFIMTKKWSLFYDVFHFGCCNCKHNLDSDECVMNLDNKIYGSNKSSHNSTTKKGNIDELYSDVVLYVRGVTEDKSNMKKDNDRFNIYYK